MELARKLRALREEHHLTQEEVAAKIDPPYTAGAVAAWEQGRANPRLAVLYQLASLYQIGIYELLGTAEGETMCGSSAYLPLVSTAHMGDFDPQDEPDRLVEVPASIAERHPNGFVIRGIGDCMNRQLPEDCVLVIDPDLPPRNGEAVMVESEEYQAMVRTYIKGNDTLILSADSYTRDYEDIVIRPTDSPVKILGVVVWYQANEDVHYA